MRNAGKIMIVVAAALSLGACANSEEASTAPAVTGPPLVGTPPPSSSASSSAAAEPDNHARECTAEDIKVTGDPGKKPEITIPDTCKAPTKLLSKDLQAGTGAEAKAGTAVQMNYQLVAWSTKQQKDSSFDRGEPFPLTLGQGQVIQGWDQGLVGIKQGARRLLVVPPNLGYGAAPNHPLKTETLVFVVDAVKVG
ncbi:FKBP-type peptidyl-prolyl cis-trans isomerase [Amycolatopsis anabasis]|uniref:FKBP-type peptidyl-prolyl cis-trans isomerase n=1 Tax=Amycolatopsis anabasis TaxID=1840409 RepID=UPI00131BE2AD|nr:FKBP-type peptidyl-prolyl cis-trans isomerase [Amycolatopsis anabasis]